MGSTSLEQAFSATQPLRVDVAHLDSLEEITHWLGTFRERLRQARATDRQASQPSSSTSSKTAGD